MEGNSLSLQGRVRDGSAIIIGRLAYFLFPIPIAVCTIDFINLDAILSNGTKLK